MDDSTDLHTMEEILNKLARDAIDGHLLLLRGNRFFQSGVTSVRLAVYTHGSVMDGSLA